MSIAAFSQFLNSHSECFRFELKNATDLELTNLSGKFSYFTGAEDSGVEVQWEPEKESVLVINLSFDPGIERSDQTLIQSFVAFIIQSSQGKISRDLVRDWEYWIRDRNDQPGVPEEQSLEILKEFQLCWLLAFGKPGPDQFCRHFFPSWARMLPEQRLKALRLLNKSFIKLMTGVEFHLDIISVDGNCLELDIQGSVNHQGILEKYQDFAVKQFQDWEINCILKENTHLIR
jgi:hypothetical protein